MKFLAHLHRISKDSEGEVTIVFKVPATDAHKAMEIPTEEILQITIEKEVT